MRYSSDIKNSDAANMITINNCGELRVNEDSHILRLNGRNDYQVIYVCEGQCVVTLKETKITANAGDYIIYRPGEVQDYLLAKKAKPRTFWIHFNGKMCSELFETLCLQDAHIVSAENNRELEFLVTRICHHYNLKTPNYEMICSGLMQSVLTLLSNEFHNRKHPSDLTGNDKISEMISRVKMTPNLNFSVAKCAETCNMSKSHFARVFKQITGKPPVQFMLEIRIERAKELLDFTDKSIAEIAEVSGFPDQNYFARIFKKFTHLSPTEYRRIGKSK